MATGTVSCPQGGHGHTHRAAQYHRLLTHHRLRLVPHLTLLGVLRLAILRLLRILRLAICRLTILRLLWVLPCLPVVRLCRRCSYRTATACTKAHPWRVLPTTACANCRSDWSHLWSWGPHIMSTMDAESGLNGNLRMASRTEMRHRRWRCCNSARRTQCRTTVHTERCACFHLSITTRTGWRGHCHRGTF